MTSQPSLDGFHHVALTVSDLERSVAWYRDVLGFEELRRVSGSGMSRCIMGRSGLAVTLVHHGDLAVAGEFTERRTGLDHLSFALADRAALDTWVAHLDSRGVVHSPVAQGGSGSLVAFRDPDNIALELYTRS